MNMTNKIYDAYGDQLAKWQAPGMAKLLGPKPTPDQLMTIHRLGARHGKQCFANAMALRDCGVTGAEIMMACDNQQLNKMRGFVTDRLLDRHAVGKRNGGEIYKVTVTPKGQKRIDLAVKLELAAVEAGKVTDKVKPVAKAKVKVVKKATSGHRKPTGTAAKLPANVMTTAAASATVEPVEKPVDQPAPVETNVEQAANDSRLPDVSL
jgi:hypothetical protein